MQELTRANSVKPATPPAARLGDRLRQLRVAAGLTQTDVAGDRFSKEYISQIERGKTRPTQETVDWLASRLGVDATFLSSGVSADGRARAEALLARADALSAARAFEPAIEQYTQAVPAALTTGAVELHVRALAGEAWARAHAGAWGRAQVSEVRLAIDLLQQARGYAEGPEFSDVD